MSPALGGGFIITAPPGKSGDSTFKNHLGRISITTGPINEELAERLQEEYLFFDSLEDQKQQ